MSECACKRLGGGCASERMGGWVSELGSIRGCVMEGVREDLVQRRV
jgi:hypothetical protein